MGYGLGGGVVRVTRYPAGSLLIKENFNTRKKLVGVTAMLKLPHYDGADRNWVMAAYSPQGKPLAFGKVGSCIQCHMVARKQDFVFAPHQPAASRLHRFLLSGSENSTRLSPLAPGTSWVRAMKEPDPGPAMEVFPNPAAFILDSAVGSGVFAPAVLASSRYSAMFLMVL